jgi:hypothetical protein
MSCPEGLVEGTGTCHGCAAPIPRESVQTLFYGLRYRVDPAASTIEFGFVDHDDARPIVSWTAGQVTDETAVGDHWTATAQTPAIGTGSLDLAPGYWHVYARVTIAGETPVIDLGSILIA